MNQNVRHTRRRRHQRQGNTLVLTVLLIVPLMAFLALSIDVGLLAMARTQCQDASDLAALAGVRTLNGTSGNNASAAAPAAQQAVARNQVLWTPVQPSQVAVNVGWYSYSPSAKQFQGTTSSGTGNYTLVKATTTANVASSLPFSQVLGVNVGALTTTAVAVSRPRDIAVVLDFSGSMRFGTFAGYAGQGNQFCQLPNVVNNEDTLVPAFGHYSAFGAGSMYATNYSSPFLAANMTATTSDGRPPMCADFYQDGNGTPAFTPNPASYASVPGGDNYLTTGKNGSSTYAQTLAQMLGITNITTSTLDSLFESKGYQGYTGVPFRGYSQGPGYYGKTFFIWPPDPTKDWRSTYFTFAGGKADNSLLWDTNGNWQAPGGSTYTINYSNILNFIQHIGPNPFPPALQSGRIAYYTAIPTTIDTSTWPPSDPNQRFWKDYIDYVLGLAATGVGQYSIINNGQQSNTGYGSDVNWGPIQITPNSSLGLGLSVGLDQRGRSLFAIGDTLRPTAFSLSAGVPGLLTSFQGWGGWGGGGWGGGGWGGGGSGSGGTGGGGSGSGSGSGGSLIPFMCYGDNPMRPLLNFWFGPLTMVDFLDNYKLFPGNYLSNNRYCWWPGTCHESPMYECKLGVQAALNDIQSNHPNDWVSLIMFSIPKASSNDSTGRFNGARVGLGLNYSNMSDSLWYPPATIGNSGATVTPYDANNLEVPRAYGGTCYSQALMLAYNQFSCSTACSGYAAPAGVAGGNGRQGAQKIIIFETDGAPNATANAQLVNNGAYQSYYKIRYNPGSPGGGEYPTNVNGGSWGYNNSGAVVSQIQSLCQQICALDSASTPGYSTNSRPVLIHCLSFGPLVDSTTLQTLNMMQTIGNVDDNMPSYKIINGSQAQNIANLQEAFTNILESTVPISLIQ